METNRNFAKHIVSERTDFSIMHDDPWNLQLAVKSKETGELYYLYYVGSESNIAFRFKSIISDDTRIRDRKTNNINIEELIKDLKTTIKVLEQLTEKE